MHTGILFRGWILHSSHSFGMCQVAHLLVQSPYLKMPSVTGTTLYRVTKRRSGKPVDTSMNYSRKPSKAQPHRRVTSAPQQNHTTATS